MALTIPDASAEGILAAAEAVHYTRPSIDLSLIAGYMRAPEDRAREALKGATLLGFLREPTEGAFEPAEETLRLTIHSNSAERRTLFRFRLECFPPFRLFKERVLCGDSPLESVDKVRHLYSIESPDRSKLKEVFQQWGQFANALVSDIAGTTLVAASSDALEPAYLKAVGSAVAKAEGARVFIQRRLGEEHFARLPLEAVDNLSSALTRCESKHDPKTDIAFAIGTAMEKVLSSIAASSQPPVDLTGTTGINTMAERLKGNAVITGKHVGLIHAIGAIRNAADHGVDTEIARAWSLTHDALLDLTLLTLDVVRSLFEWTTRHFPVI